MMLLFAPNSSGAAPVGWLARTWVALGMWGRIGVVMLGVILLGMLLFFGLRWLSRRLGPKLWFALIALFTGGSLIALVTLGFIAAGLPNQKGAVFVVEHQLIRIGAVLGGMGFVVGISVL